MASSKRSCAEKRGMMAVTGSGGEVLHPRHWGSEKERKRNTRLDLPDEEERQKKRMETKGKG